MVKFRQKLFFLGTALMIGLPMVQASSQAKEQEAQMEEQKKALDKQAKALNRIATEAQKSPQIAQQVVQEKQMSEKSRIRLFANIKT